jgi:tetratricopeptide (TPR) repeat protein
VHAFETAMEALQRHRYGDAAQRFRQLMTQFPAERGLLDRARVYADLAEREVRRLPAQPQTVEERLTAATAALNNDDDQRAESLARSVLAANPEQDLALYLLAAVEARRGKTEAALSYLGQAIAISPEVRAQAKHDADFESLRNLEAFRELTDPPPATGAQQVVGGGGRRPRRPLR